MQISEIMTRDVQVASPEDNIQRAARMMADLDIGALPVGQDDHLVGMITDRDIAVRAVAQGKAPDACKVRDIMSTELKYCYEDESTEHVAQNMGDLQIRRLPVVNRNKRLVGVVSLGDMAVERNTDAEAEEALSKISEPAHHGRT